MKGGPLTTSGRSALRGHEDHDSQPMCPPAAATCRNAPTLRIDCAWRLGLAHALQTTLDVERTLELFAKHCATIVAHDAFAFTASDSSTSVTRGIPGSCRHRIHLELAERSLGRIVFWRRRPFEAGEIRALEEMTIDLAHPLDNALRYREAREAATRDPLTGAGNRGHLERTLQREMSLVRRHGGALSLLMIDMDHFKRINDRFGHSIGDRSLVAVADCAAGCVRDSDALFRYGGEEFCVLLPRTGTHGAWRLAERMREAIGTLRIPVGGETIRLSASLGVASLAPGEGAAELLRKADVALYRSKRSGRNTVSAADEVLDRTGPRHEATTRTEMTKTGHFLDTLPTQGGHFID